MKSRVGPLVPGKACTLILHYLPNGGSRVYLPEFPTPIPYYYSILGVGFYWKRSVRGVGLGLGGAGVCVWGYVWGILGRYRIIDVDTNSKAYDACYCHRLYTDDTQYCYQNDITIIFK